MNADHMRLLVVTFISQTKKFELGRKQKPVTNSFTAYFCDMHFPSIAIEAYFATVQESYSALKLYVDLDKVPDFKLICHPSDPLNEGICAIKVDYSIIKLIELRPKLEMEAKDKCF